MMSEVASLDTSHVAPATPSPTDGYEITECDGPLQVVEDSVFINENSDPGELACIKEIRSFLVVEETTSWVDLRPLRNLRRLDGSLMIENNAMLTSLAGLEQVAYGGHGVSLTRNPMLSDISALESLGSMSALFIEGNDSLESLGGLTSNVQVKGKVDIIGNPQLVNLSAFEVNITGEEVNIQIMDNASLASVAAPAFGADRMIDVALLRITGNPQLTSLEGLGGMQFNRISSMEIQGERLQDLAVFRDVPEADIVHLDVPMLPDLSDLSDLRTVWELEMSNMDLVEDLAPLSSLEQAEILVIGSCTLSRENGGGFSYVAHPNNGLRSLKGLENLGRRMQVVLGFNPNLEDISALERPGESGFWSAYSVGNESLSDDIFRQTLIGEFTEDRWLLCGNQDSERAVDGDCAFYICPFPPILAGSENHNPTKVQSHAD